MKKLLTALFSSLLFALALNAQHLDVGFSFGNASYIGDLITPRNGGHLTQYNLAQSAFLNFHVDRFSFRAAIMKTSLEGDDKNGIYPGRGLHFRTPILETSLTAAFHLSYIKFNYSNSYLAPYIFGGVAAYKFNPQALYKEEWVDLQPLGTEGQGIEGYPAPYQLIEVAIPFGLGIKVKVNKKIGFAFELGIRKLFNDYLDDVSGTEISYLELFEGNGPRAVALSIPFSSSIIDSKESIYTRGASGNDMYFLYELSFSYTISGSDKHLRFYYR